MRTARKRCESNVYHVIVRGVGKQILFEDDADRAFFLETLADKRSDHGVGLYAWCLMSNHVHIVLRAPLEDISAMMHALETRYAGHFNFRHARSGALFQGRFTSVPVETDEQLMQAIRYVHRNPVEAGLPIDGAWSSYREYMGAGHGAVADVAFVLELFGGVDAFALFHRQDGSRGGVGGHPARLPRPRILDEEALRVAKGVLGDVGPYDLKALDKRRRDALLVQLREAGLSARQISRITSIGENVVYRAR